MDTLYYVRSRGRVQGPFTLDELKMRAKRRKLSRFEQVSTDQVNWSPASQFAEIFPPPPPPPPPTPPAEAIVVEPATEQKASDTQPVQQEAEAADAYPISAEQSPVEAKPPEPDQLWHYIRNDQEEGPVPFSQLQSLASQGLLGPGDFIWSEGMPGWIEAREVDGVFPVSSSWWQVCQGGDRTAICPMAVASFVLGLLGTSCLFFLGSIAAVVFGHIALSQIRQSGNTLSGRGLAIAGLILGYVVVIAGTLIGVVALVVKLLR